MIPAEIYKTTEGIESTERGIIAFRDRLQLLNALTVTGAFLAAVQAQLASLTYNANETALQTATNTISFAGLVLDIIGTTSGLLGTLCCHQYITQLTEVLESIRKIPQSLREIHELDRAMRSHPTQELRGALRSHWENQRRWANDFNHVRPLLKWALYGWSTRFNKNLSDYSWVLHIDNSCGMFSIVSMSLGILCFLCTTVCFVFETQRLATQIVTVFVLVASGWYCSATLIMRYDARRGKSVKPYEDSITTEKLTELDNVNITLLQCS
ncbi:hypothetical protein BD410DRAFT_80461 [Rickenella mellea]|uniref:Uncharacterized protein n=1 Tax=Rickenella mellea TaxID=50990 RepID=A0A4Y7PL44_9AGAM|nr:hypothetical protein BD410DRAFT_80461 [Rickenella mellea]